ncbi:hypothetical protein CR513_04230, partial [Mucuna pruriens]
MNHGRVGRRYDLKFATYGLESSRKSIVGIHHKRKLSESFLRKKIRNGHDRATWIPLSVRTILDEHWASTDFQNKRSIAKENKRLHNYNGPPTTWEVVEKTKKLKSGEWVNDKTRELALKYEQRRQEVQKSTTEEASSANDSNSVPINDNDIYLEVVGGKKEKGNVYGLGKLTNKFIRSTCIPTNLIDMSTI